MRVRVPVLAFVGACFVGTATLFLLVLLDMQTRDGAPEPGPIDVWISDFALGVVGAAAISLPLGLPTIIATERRGGGPIWIFLCLALFHVLLIATWFVFENSRVEWDILAALTLPFALGWLAYWFVAWKLLPPEPDLGAEREVFQ